MFSPPSAGFFRLDIFYMESQWLPQATLPNLPTTITDYDFAACHSLSVSKYRRAVGASVELGVVKIIDKNMYPNSDRLLKQYSEHHKCAHF